MRQSLRCPRCRGRRFFRIQPVRERGPERVPLAVYRSADGRIAAGRFELWVCARCGAAEWSGVDLGPLAGAPEGVGLRDSTRCAACGQTGPRWHLHRVRTANGDPLPVRAHRLGAAPGGGFALDLCGACGLACWTAYGLGTLQIAPPPCPACGHPGLVRIARFGAIALPALELEACPRCGRTEWRARKVDVLRPDPTNGIHLVEAEASGGGPYR